MSIRLIVKVGAEGTAIILSIPGPSVKFIVEALPLTTSAIMVAEFVRCVRPSDTLCNVWKFLEVVANDSFNFTTIDQVDELGLDASIKVSLDKRGFIAVDLNVREVRVLFS